MKSDNEETASTTRNTSRTSRSFQLLKSTAISSLASLLKPALPFPSAGVERADSSRINTPERTRPININVKVQRQTHTSTNDVFRNEGRDASENSHRTSHSRSLDHRGSRNSDKGAAGQHPGSAPRIGTGAGCLHSKGVQRLSPTHVKRMLSSFHQEPLRLGQSSQITETRPSPKNRIPTASVFTSPPVSQISSPLDSSLEQPNETPPLTPDSFNDGYLSDTQPSPYMDRFTANVQSEDSSFERLLVDDTISAVDDSPDDGYDEEALSAGTMAERISDVKAGKKPERPGRPCLLQAPEENSGSKELDADEWIGLEYTIELSARERRRTDTEVTPTEGEYSKSRESWLALHPDIDHPEILDAEFNQWRTWRQHLDSEESTKLRDSTDKSAMTTSKSLVSRSGGSLQRPIERAWWAKGQPSQQTAIHQTGLFTELTTRHKRAKTVGCLRELVSSDSHRA
ncbi:hypothetical protein HGRIS_009869 [Hohenbuehelia grisea]|uniref:Uncharacterized protein n=1 Tax=Hohenbuehelia grisea TaxID=104357 RepID=A0ABR3J2G0_9AGAR